MNRTLYFLLILLIFNSCKKERKEDQPDNGTNSSVVVSGIVPSLVTAGSVVTISGANFGTSTSNTKVFFDGQPATIQTVSSTEIKALVPATKSGQITVVIGDKTVKGPTFSYTEDGKITGISPASGGAGTLVRITGANLGATGPVTISFNGVNAEVKGRSSTDIMAVVPVTSTGPVVITTGNASVQGPVFEFTGPATIKSILPTEGTAGSVVTISGSNFGATSSGLQVLFNGKSATVNSVTSSEIKVTVPVTTTGLVTLSINGQVTEGPTFNYTSPLSSVYTTGNVTLTSQAEVDAFVKQNEGRQLRITGSLTVSGNDIRSTAGLSNIVSVTQNLTMFSEVLNDLSFLNSITSVGGNIALRDLPATDISMDKLTGTVKSVTVNACKYLRSLNFRMVNNITGDIYSGGLSITACDQISDIDFSNLNTITYRFLITGTAIQDFSKFNSLQSAGLISISANRNLKSFQGLEKLTTLSMAAYTSTGLATSTSINGLYVADNPTLNSLNGLQNLSNVPVIRMLKNPMLTDFCPAKSVLMKLKALPDYIYYRQNPQLSGIGVRVNLPALTLSNNGGYTSTGDVIIGLAACL